MGKRKSRAKPAPKKRMDKLDIIFSCPFVTLAPVSNAACKAWVQIFQEIRTEMIQGLVPGINYAVASTVQVSTKEQSSRCKQ
ncbi:hypothetical protein Goklo_007887 [Gossypium klotzschianum]|uniref:Uncharacterized protein n=1 Tax=Gossypium klotzschianum TaxID=34286 RepID=A0A7J8UXY9_9ROSI|nr:hypothetical protein [Gossypium klotzschianum]